MEIQLEMKDRNISERRKERRKINRNHAQFKHKLEQRRIKYSKKIEKKREGAWQPKLITDYQMKSKTAIQFYRR